MYVFASRVRARNGLAALLLSLVATLAHASAPPDPVWQDIDANAIAARGERWVSPATGRVMALDFPALTTRLLDAPKEGQANLRDSALEVTLPMADGSWQRFRVVETYVMAPELAARYPEIRSFFGQGVDNPAASVRFDYNPRGFFAQVLAPGGDTYIDPWQAGDNAHYVVYARAGAGNGKGYRCLLENDDRPNFSPLVAKAPPLPKNPSGATLRTHRIAMLVSQNYTNSYGGTVLGALSGIVTTVNRLSGIYERDVALRFQLVANNDLIIYTTANPSPVPDPPSNFGTIQTTVNNAIGAANYDIGHMMGANGGGGAVTPLGNVCGASKAQGYTSLNPPRGDIFDVDFVAHELGHQYGGRHTWNGSSGSCSAGQWASTAAMEPGSGTTIMAYAGICTGQNLQPNSDAYFHTISFTEIFTTINSGGPGNGNTVCGTTAPSGNTPPTIAALTPMTIPERTPFQLTAAASDTDTGPADLLTYAWENTDLGARGVPSTNGDNGTAPLFRSFNPTTSPTRVFPSLRYILNNANVPPATITLPPAAGTYVPAEILPDPASGTRVMNFRVTVRDNRAGGGGVRHAANTVTAVSTAGPFLVDNITGPWTGGGTQAVTWQVAGTDAAPINTTQVNILVSTDGGYTFTPLVSGTPNDGNQTITVPSLATTQARIRVEAANGAGVGAGNTYFDINDANFTINATGTPITLTMGTTPILVSQGGPGPVPVQIATISGGTAPYTVAAAATPAEPEISIVDLGAGTSAVTASATATCNIAAPNAAAGRAYPHVLRVTDSAGRTASGVFNVNVTNNTIPTVGAYANARVAVGEARVITPAAPPADGNGNYATATVSPATLPGGGTLAINPVTGVVTATTTAGTTLGTVPVEVRVSDSCGAVDIERFTLTIDNILFADSFE